jgi:hypothetical protein
MKPGTDITKFCAANLRKKPYLGHAKENKYQD